MSHRHAVFPWMLEYAAHLLNQYEVGRDGRTAYERLKAKKAKPLGMEVGELVQWRALEKLDSVWDHGVFLEVKGKTGEIVIGARIRRSSTRGSVGKTMRSRTRPTRNTSGSSWRALGCSRTPTGWSRRRWRMQATPTGTRISIPTTPGSSGVGRSRQLPLAGQSRRPIRRKGGLSTHGGSFTGRLGNGWFATCSSFPRYRGRSRGGECETDTIDVFSDSDWAGCVRTRRSTSRGVVTVGGSAIKHWSLTQAAVALTSGEAEYLALVKAACEGIGIQALARDLGWEMRLIIHVDSSTARSFHRESHGRGKTPAHGDGSFVGPAGRQGMQVRSVQGGVQSQPRRHSHEADVVGRGAGEAQRYWGHCSCSRRALTAAVG